MLLSSRRLVATGVAVAVISLVGAACSSTPGASSSGGTQSTGASASAESSTPTASTGIPGEGAVLETADYGAISEPWYVWNDQTCAFEEAQDHPATYQALLRQEPSSVFMIFTPESTTFPVDHLFNYSVEQAAKKAGVKYLQLSNDYPSTDRPLQVADQAVTAKPGVVLSGNILPAVYPQIQKKYTDACIPMVNVYSMKGPTLPAPGVQTPFIGDGQNMADAAIEMIKQRNWPADQIWIVSCGESAIAPGPGTNLDTVTAFRDRIKQEFSVPDSHISPILECPQTNGGEGARAAVADWLTAHPDAKYVVGSNWNDVRGQGMATALTDKGFSTNGLICGRDAADGALARMASGDPVFACDLDPGFLHWGVLLISMGEDILAGRPVPSYAAPQTVVVTPANVQQVIAERAAVPK